MTDTIQVSSGATVYSLLALLLVTDSAVKISVNWNKIGNVINHVFNQQYGAA